MDGLLVKYIADLDVFDTEESVKIKQKDIELLKLIATKWVLEISNEMNHNVKFSKTHLPCDIRVQGSTSIGVSFKESDVDVVLLTPLFINHGHFFGSFVNTLREIDQCKILLTVPDACVPLIKMKINNTTIDLIMSQLTSTYVPSDIDKVPMESLYTKVDEASINGLAGLQFVNKLRELEPVLPMFTDLLKVIKLWTSRRLINENIYGFPASVGWVILCAYVCQLAYTLSNPFAVPNVQPFDIELNEANQLPNTFDNVLQKVQYLVHERLSVRHQGNANSSELQVSQLLKMFFTYFSNWNWESPVIISPISSVTEQVLECLNPGTVNPPMSIITPVYPHKNVASSVTSTNRDIVTEELHRGMDIMQQILNGEACWDKLFEPYDIRSEYRHFLKITFNADSSWEYFHHGGLIDSRLRALAGNLERNELIRSTRIVKASDLPPGKPYRRGCMSLTPTRRESGPDVLRRVWYIGMDIVPDRNSTNSSNPETLVDATPAIVKFYDNLRRKNPTVNFASKLDINYVSRKEVTSDCY